MECLSIVASSVLVNGSSTDEFNLERGLHQGEALSPFLILIDVEVLNVMLNVIVEAGLF
jgi:hypothetical protein